MSYTNYTIVSARCSSSRLPNKALLEINNDLKSIEIVIERAKLIGLPVILATSNDSSDDSLEHIARKHHIHIFRGELENKIKRWRDCFNKFQIDYAVQIDGDDLCYDFNLAKKALEKIHDNEYDIITCKKDVITGLFTFVLTRDSIEKLFLVAKEKSINTDIIIKFIEKAGLKVGFLETSSLEINKNIRLTLDYKEDFEFFKKLYSLIDSRTTTKEIIEFLEENPNICKINFHKQADFIKNQEKFNNSVKI